MTNIKIEAGDNTPEIIVNYHKSRFELSGVVCPENPIVFFGLLDKHLSDFTKECTGQKTICFRLVYFNSSSAKFLYTFLKSLKSHENIKVEWLYEEGDTDLLESGQDYAELTGLNFEFIAFGTQ